MRALVVRPLQRGLVDVTNRKVGNRIASGLEQDHRLVASRDDAALKLDTHPSAQRLHVKHPLGHRRSCEKRPIGIASQRPLLP